MVTLGVVLGQNRTPTAIAVAQIEVREVAGREEVHFVVRHLERLPAKTALPEITRRVAEIQGQVTERSGQVPTCFLDATWSGTPVVELFATHGVEAVACYFNHGDRRTKKDHREIVIGKAFLVTRLKVLLETGRLHLPRTPESETLARDLREYEIRPEPNANDLLGAFRVGSQDEFVTAVGLAVQVDRPSGPSVFLAANIPGW